MKSKSKSQLRHCPPMTRKTSQLQNTFTTRKRDSNSTAEHHWVSYTKGIKSVELIVASRTVVAREILGEQTAPATSSSVALPSDLGPCTVMICGLEGCSSCRKKYCCLAVGHATHRSRSHARAL